MTEPNFPYADPGAIWRLADDRTGVVHHLKVPPPYFAAILDGTKTFELRRNDRAFQRGDRVRLCEWHPAETAEPGYGRCDLNGCKGWRDTAHWHSESEPVEKLITYVYAGDPRFGGLEPGHVILGLGAV